MNLPTVNARGGIEDTTFVAKAKDTKKIQGQAKDRLFENRPSRDQEQE